MWQPNLVLYHKGCNDGFGAAWAAWRRWNETDAIFLPVSYGDRPQTVISGGEHVLMVDVTYKAEQLAEIANKVGSMVILDHHATARDDLAPYQVGMAGFGLMVEGVPSRLRAAIAAGLGPIIAHFNMLKSGARLAWEFTHGHATAPALIDYIEDHDLYRRALAGSDEFAAALGSYEHDFEVWQRLAGRSTFLADEGEHILRNKRREIAQLLPYAEWVFIGGKRVPVLNVPFQMATLAGHALLEHFPDAPFVGTWMNRGKRDQWSLRSQDHREDVSAIAMLYDGGGHRNAAGFHADLGGLYVQMFGRGTRPGGCVVDPGVDQGATVEILAQA